MARNVFTTSISLPKSMAKTLARMRAWENCSTSQLIREALRHYERTAPVRRMTPETWQELRTRLKRISTAGRKVNLATFVARDRYRH